jgi:deoxyribonuclease V
VDVHYLESGGARAALVLAEDATFATIRHSATALVNEAAPYRPGEFYRRELPALHAVLDDVDDVKDIELLVVDGYVDLDPSHRPGLGAYAHHEFNVPAIGVAKTRFLTAAETTRDCRHRRGNAPGRSGFFAASSASHATMRAGQRDGERHSPSSARVS